MSDAKPLKILQLQIITDIILDEDTLRTRETDGPRPREVELRQEWTRENDEYFFI
jgi:hypothetical protein